MAKKNKKKAKYKAARGPALEHAPSQPNLPGAGEGSQGGSSTRAHPPAGGHPPPRPPQAPQGQRPPNAASPRAQRPPPTPWVTVGEGDTWIVAQPQDVLFFRGGRPFSAGESHGGFGAQLPWPSTVYGFLRTTLAEHRADLPRGADPFAVFRAASPHPLLGNASQAGGLRAAGPFIVERRRGGPWRLLLATPADLLRHTARGTVSQPSLQPRAGSRFAGGGSSGEDALDRLPVGRHLVQITEAQGFVSPGQLATYLAGSWPASTASASQPRRAEEVFAVERRVGIARTPGEQVTEEGMLYAAGFLRLADGPDLERALAFVVAAGAGWDAAAPPQLPRTARMGGEGRCVDLSASPLALPPLSQPPAGATGLLLYLATPAVWERGWLPDWVGGDLKIKASLHPQLAGWELVSVASGPAQALSGWDLARGGPKATRMAVPPGAVYRLAPPEGASLSAVAPALAALHGASTAVDPSDRQMGWGLALLGFW